MGALTAKTIRPACAGYAQNMVPSSAAFAQIDEELNEFGLDSGNGAASPSTTLDTITGLVSVQQDPLHPSVAPGFTTSNPVTITGTNPVTGAPSMVASVLGSGGRLICGSVSNSDVPTYTSNRSRVVNISFLEMCYSAPNWNYSTNLANAGTPYVVVPSTFGVQRSSQSQGACQLSFNVPITKPHTSAVLSQIVVYYYLTVAPTSMGVTPPLLEVVGQRTNVQTTNIDNFGTCSYSPANAGAYYANGAIQTMTMTTSGSTSHGTVLNLMDLGTFTYALVVSDDNASTWPAGVGSGVVWLGAQLTYTTIGNENFPQ